MMFGVISIIRSSCRGLIRPPDTIGDPREVNQKFSALPFHSPQANSVQSNTHPRKETFIMAVSLKPLNQQTIVITGASSGIGLTTARMAARQGAKLVLA